MEVLTLIAAAMTLVLGPFAIWLSVTFYHKATDAERETAKALEAIKAQTGTLERLTGKWMDRLTRYVTGPRPADESLTLLVTTLAQLPTHLLAQLQTPGTARSDVRALTDELVNTYIAIYYYVGIANVLAQGLLPDESDFDDANELHSGLQRLVDMSAQDFTYMAGILERIELPRLDASPYKHLLDEAVSEWRPLVQNTAGHYRARRED